jgi:hypothetical protein
MAGVYPKPSLSAGLQAQLGFDNAGRPTPSLDFRTQAEVYRRVRVKRSGRTGVRDRPVVA